VKNIHAWIADIKADLEKIERANNKIADSVFDMEAMFRPATQEEVKEKIDAEVFNDSVREASEDMKLALEQCDPFNYN